jgi:hypothetical protein
MDLNAWDILNTWNLSKSTAWMPLKTERFANFSKQESSANTLKRVTALKKQWRNVGIIFFQNDTGW